MQKRCPNCMEPLEEDLCPACGYDVSTAEETDPAGGTILKDRYYLGRIFLKDEVTTVYIGFDQELESKVFIRKFSGDGILDNENVTLDKKGMVERYLEYGKSVASISLCDILPRTVDVFECDDVGYIITEYFEGKTLKDIMASGIRVSEGNAYKITGKLCDGLKIMHDSHMIFGNLCPSTLYILKDGGIRLFGMGSPFFEFVKDVDILAEVLNPSYAAPELFEEHEPSGSYCDVYSVSAILYRMLTDIIPPISFLRCGGETLVKPNKANPEIDKSVSVALLNALNWQIEKRTFNTDMFLNELDDPNVRRRKSANDGKAAFLGTFQHDGNEFYSGEDEEDTKKGPPIGIILFFILGLLLLVGIVVLLLLIVPDDSDDTSSTSSQTTVTSTSSNDGWYSEDGNKREESVYSTFSSRPSSESSSSIPDTALPEGIVKCPNCVNFTIADAEDLLKEHGLELGQVSYEYSTEYIKGYVMAHKKGSEAGNNFQKGSKIHLIVSNGYPPDTTSDIPDVVGKDMTIAIAEFNEADFTNVTYEFVDIAGKNPGEIISVDPPAGGEPVSIDTAITVKVNGKAVAVPDYSGKTLKEAIELEPELKIATISEEGNGMNVSEAAYSNYVVVGQNISADFKVYSGMTITLTVKLG